MFLSASGGGQEALPSLYGVLRLTIILGRGGLKCGKSTPAAGAGEPAFPALVAQVSELFLAPEESKLAAELDHLRPQLWGPLSPVRQAVVWGHQGAGKMETLPPSIPSLQRPPIWWGKLQHQCWALYAQGWGEVCTKGRELGDLFLWERVSSGTGVRAWRAGA